MDFTCFSFLFLLVVIGGLCIYGWITYSVHHHDPDWPKKYPVSGPVVVLTCPLLILLGLIVTFGLILWLHSLGERPPIGHH